MEISERTKRSLEDFFLWSIPEEVKILGHSPLRFSYKGQIWEETYDGWERVR